MHPHTSRSNTKRTQQRTFVFLFSSKDIRRFSKLLQTTPPSTSYLLHTAVAWRLHLPPLDHAASSSQAKFMTPAFFDAPSGSSLTHSPSSHVTTQRACFTFGSSNFSHSFCFSHVLSISTGLWDRNIFFPFILYNTDIDQRVNTRTRTVRLCLVNLNGA